MTRARGLAAATVLITILAACGGETTGSQPTPTSTPSTNPSVAAVTPAASTTVPPSDWIFPRCEDVPQVSAQPGVYRDEPIYVGNEMPVDEVRAWAVGQPGYQGIWIDREHNGWISVAFSADAEARQRDLEQEFPGVGVVAIAVDYDIAELEALRGRVHEALIKETDSFATWTSENRGVTGLDLGVLTDDLRTLLEDQFAGERLCVDYLDPGTLPPPGPQPEEGDGWSLLVDAKHAGMAYRTGIAFDNESLQNLWDTIGLDSTIPEIDFDGNVVIWFGAVFGSSCPDIRLDDVVVDGALVYAEIVLPIPPAICTADANPHAYVVTLERSHLPEGPFVIQLDADGPPGGASEERTVVDVDLSEPGSVAGPGDVGFDTSPPEPHAVESGDIIETGFPWAYRLETACGIEWLGELNSVRWRTTETMPANWEPSVNEDGTIIVIVTIHEGPDPFLEAETNGEIVRYEPSADPVPNCG